MARFYVGQRVRILYSNGWPELAGQEGTVVEPTEDGGLSGASEWRVAPDCWGTHLAPYKCPLGASIFAPNSSQLEPLYDGHTPVSWESMKDLWVPEEALCKALEEHQEATQ